LYSELVSYRRLSLRFAGLLVAASLFAGCRSKTPEPVAPQPAASEEAAPPPATDAAVPDGRPVIIAFGDSLTAGYGADTGDSYPDYLEKDLNAKGYHYQVINQGISGNTTKDGVDRLQDALRLKPALVIVGFGGNQPEVAHLIAQVSAILGAGCEVVADSEAIAAYQRLRDFDPADAVLCAQIAVAPAELAPCLRECRAEYRAHAGSGVAQIFASNPQNSEDVRLTVARWREIARRGRGNLRVIRVNEEFRDGVSIFDEPPPAAFALMRRLKTAFDPRSIFNPACFVGGL